MQFAIRIPNRIEFNLFGFSLIDTSFIERTSNVRHYIKCMNAEGIN